MNLSKVGIGAKIWLLVGIVFVGMTLSGVYGLVQLKTSLLEDRKDKVRNLVEASASLVASFAKKAASGEMTEVDAKALAKEAVKNSRYEGGNYFWLNDVKSVIVMHPIKPELDGKDLSGLKDSQGTAIFTEFSNTVKNHGEGYVPYLWPKPGSEEPVQKISYVKGIPEWGWVVGSGIYVDDVDTAFAKQAGANGGHFRAGSADIGRFRRFDHVEYGVPSETPCQDHGRVGGRQSIRRHIRCGA